MKHLAEIRVLTADDNAADRAILKAALMSLGLRDIQEAEDGVVAEYKIQNSVQVHKPYEVLLLDWRMPGATGLTLIRMARATRGTKWSRILMISGVNDQAQVQEAIDSGVDDFLLKPYDLKVLTERLRKLLGIAKAS